MTTLAQLERLVSTLPSDVVSQIHDYARHPVAELFKAAQRRDNILLKHPAIRRFQRAMGMVHACHEAFLSNNDDLFESNIDGVTRWYYDNEEQLDDADWVFFDCIFDELEDMHEEIYERRRGDE